MDLRELTKREKEVFYLFVNEGLDTQEIANRLIIDITTARTHFNLVFQKLYYFGKNRRAKLLVDYYKEKIREMRVNK